MMRSKNFNSQVQRPIHGRALRTLAIGASALAGLLAVEVMPAGAVSWSSAVVFGAVTTGATSPAVLGDVGTTVLWRTASGGIDSASRIPGSWLYPEAVPYANTASGPAAAATQNCIDPHCDFGGLVAWEGTHSHAVWYETGQWIDAQMGWSGSQHELAVSESHPTTVSPVVVENLSNACDGNVVAAWTSGTKIYYAIGRFTTPEQVNDLSWSGPYSVPGSDTKLSPAVAFDSQGDLYTFWTAANAAHADQIAFAKESFPGGACNASTWSSVQYLTNQAPRTATAPSASSEDSSSTPFEMTVVYKGRTSSNVYYESYVAPTPGVPAHWSSQAVISANGSNVATGAAPFISGVEVATAAPGSSNCQVDLEAF